MPFQSKAQMRLFFAKAKHNKKWAARAKLWAAHTKNMKGLPDKK